MNLLYTRVLSALILLPCVATSLRAAQPDPYVPERTEFYIRINVRRLIDAALVRQDLGQMRQSLKAFPQVQVELDALGFDPFTDLDSVTMAGAPSQGSDYFLLIAHGRFDFQKLAAWMQKTLSRHSERWSVVEEHGARLLAFDPPGQGSPIYIGWPDSQTMVASPAKSMVARTLEIGKGKAQASLNQPAADLLNEVDDSKVVSFMALGSAFQDTPFGESIRSAKGSLGISEGVYLAVAITAKDASAAEQLEKNIHQALGQAKVMATRMSHQQKELEPLALAVRSATVTRDGNTINIAGNFTKSMLDKRGPGRGLNSPSSRRPPSKRPPGNP